MISAQISIQIISTLLVAAPFSFVSGVAPSSFWCKSHKAKLPFTDQPFLLYLCCHKNLFSSPKLSELRFSALFPPLELLCFDHGQATKTPQSQERQHICSFSSVALLQAFNHRGTKSYGFATLGDIAMKLHCLVLAVWPWQYRGNSTAVTRHQKWAAAWRAQAENCAIKVSWTISTETCITILIIRLYNALHNSFWLCMQVEKFWEGMKMFCCQLYFLGRKMNELQTLGAKKIFRCLLWKML